MNPANGAVTELGFNPPGWPFYWVRLKRHFTHAFICCLHVLSETKFPMNVQYALALDVKQFAVFWPGLWSLNSKHAVRQTLLVINKCRIIWNRVV